MARAAQQNVRPTGEYRVVKPFFEVDIAPNAQSSLEAHLSLVVMMDERLFKQASNLRPPMGIYNISVTRVCDRVIRFCDRLEQYFRASDTLAPSKAKDDVTQELGGEEKGTGYFSRGQTTISGIEK